MSSLNSELSVLFNDDGEVEAESNNEEEEVKIKTKKKITTRSPARKTTKTKEVEVTKKLKLRKTAFIKVRVNNESKWFNEIERISELVKIKKDNNNITRIVDVFGNTGLICYWFKSFCPDVEVIMNDSENIVSKYSEEIKNKFLNNITITHTPIQDILDNISEEDSKSVLYIVNPKSFNTLSIKFLSKNINTLIFGSSKDKETDVINVFNECIDTFSLTNLNKIQHSSLVYVNEFDYLFLDVL